jgi:DNA-binding NtrC family response regulator
MTLPGKQHRVLIVDEEYWIAATLSMVLCSHGFLATFVTNSPEALETARSTPPDLLISEVSMSLLSGIELAIQMRELCPDCKVLLFSGQPNIIDLLETSRANGYTFEVLPKPIHPTALLSEIHSALGLA